MESIAEIMTPETILYLRFDDQDKTQVKQVQDALAQLADDGLVFALEFHTSQ